MLRDPKIDIKLLLRICNGLFTSKVEEKRPEQRDFLFVLKMNKKKAFYVERFEKMFAEFAVLRK